jgi:hypothetical protein
MWVSAQSNPPEKRAVVFHMETHPNGPPNKFEEGKPMSLRPREKAKIPAGKGFPK